MRAAMAQAELRPVEMRREEAPPERAGGGVVARDVLRRTRGPCGCLPTWPPGTPADATLGRLDAEARVVLQLSGSTGRAARGSGPRR